MEILVSILGSFIFVTFVMILLFLCVLAQIVMYREVRDFIKGFVEGWQQKRLEQKYLKAMKERQND